MHPVIVWIYTFNEGIFIFDMVNNKVAKWAKITAAVQLQLYLMIVHTCTLELYKYFQLSIYSWWNSFQRVSINFQCIYQCFTRKFLKCLSEVHSKIPLPALTSLTNPSGLQPMKPYSVSIMNPTVSTVTSGLCCL